VASANAWQFVTTPRLCPLVALIIATKVILLNTHGLLNSAFHLCIFSRGNYSWFIPAWTIDSSPDHYFGLLRDSGL